MDHSYGKIRTTIRCVKELSDHQRTVIGRNIAFFRRANGLTQTELAEKAGVDRRTIYTIEQGKPVLMKTLVQVTGPLNMLLAELLNVDRSPRQVDSSQPFFLHRREDDFWYENAPLPGGGRADYLEAIQSPGERRRLGQLGLVTSFRHALSFVMSKGPGLVVYEVYGRQEYTFAQHYLSWVMFGLRGELRVHLDGKETILREGDALGGKSLFGVIVEPTVPLAADREAPQFLAVGSDRAGQNAKRIRL